MLTNYHTHTTFCDGNDTVEELVLCAIGKGFDALGISSHGFTDFDLGYCMKEQGLYCDTVRSVARKYADMIQVYLGVEEDICHPVNRHDFDYIISSSHYICKDGIYYSVDSGVEYYKKCVSLFDGDPLKMAEGYFSALSEYIRVRKPDIVGHFDLITKYDEVNGNALLESREYLHLAKKYMTRALESECVFEVNTGAIARGVRSSVYPCQELLHHMKQHGAKLILSSDCHSKEHLDFYFAEAKGLLRSIGFQQIYVLYDGSFRAVSL